MEMLLNNDSRANKLHELTNNNIILSLIVNENIKIFLPFPNPTNIHF